MDTLHLENSDAIEKAMAEQDRPERVYKVGDVVFANHVIIGEYVEKDRATGVTMRHDLWIAATHGQVGVVNVASHPNYVVDFQGSGNIDVMDSDINPYQGRWVKRQIP